MRLPNPFLFVLLVACAFRLPVLLADDAKPAKDAKDDSKLLQGSWKVVALEAEGMKAPLEVLKGMRWSFNGSEVRMEDPASKDKASVKLDPSKAPKHIDFAVVEGPQKGK